MTVVALAQLATLVGQEVGTSDWLVMTQERIDAFADATGDHQWIHVDADRARAETPFGTTIAHGFLTLSLLTALMRDAITVDGPRMTLNYGLNRVRFVSPVPAGSRIRARVALGRVDGIGDSVQATWSVTIERDGGEKPCVVAEWIVRYYDSSRAVSRDDPSTSSGSPRATSRGDTRPVRTGEELEWTRLESWLREQLSQSDLPERDRREPMRVAQFPGGHSNLTYLVSFGPTELVVRRPPFGPVAPTAHDMAREYRWLAAVHPAFPLAPRAYARCEDPAIIGSVFYVMERRHGLVVRDKEPPGIQDHQAVRRAVSLATIDALADLHAIDIASAGLAHLGKPHGFVERQVRGWTDRWNRSRTSDLPEMEAVSRWLVESLPPNPARPAIVHGDFKLDNLMLDAADPARLVAVLDWEMAALGDPLVDLGIFLAYWVATAPPEQHDALTTVTTLPGWLTPFELAERYAMRSGRDLSRLKFYEVFALFKIAVVVQQIYFRFVNGQTSDPRFANLGDRVAYLARRAAAFL